MICRIIGVLTTVVIIIVGVVSGLLTKLLDAPSRPYHGGNATPDKPDIVFPALDQPGEIDKSDGVSNITANSVLGGIITSADSIMASNITSDEAMKLDFPYLRYSVTHEMLMKVFNLIKEPKYELIEQKFLVPQVRVNLKELVYKGQHIVLTVPNVYGPYWILSDYFNEQCRIHCTLYSEKSTQYDYWQKHKGQLIVETLDEDGYTSIPKLSSKVFKTIRECTTFMPFVVNIFVKIFNAKSMLDISAGWGDRLIGAMAAGIRYFGADPNPCLHDGYKAAIDFYGGGDYKKYTVVKSQFETVELPMVDGKPELFDMVLSSPPYFDVEEYATDETQSTVQYRTVQSWFNGFLDVVTKKAFSRLRVGGHMILSINNSPGREDYILLLIDSMSKDPTAKYLGVMGKSNDIARITWLCSGANGLLYAQPVWIWEKIA